MNPTELFAPGASALERTLAWLPATDYLQYPHLDYFDTLPALVHFLSTAQWEWFSERRDAMRAFNLAETSRTRAWAAAALRDLYTV